MRKPSIKSLSQVFSDPKAARTILDMSPSEIARHPVGAARIKECRHYPARVDVRLHILNSIESGLCGVEIMETVSGSDGLSADECVYYLNTGDTYAPTIIYWRGAYRVQSLGDFVERSRVKFK